ncbi:MAG: flagellar filament capping protein FliD [Selenomonas sp.]|nr:flagellar filament capping protein FliD [Selenomonas sp.]
MSATGIYGLSGSGIDVDSMVKVGMMGKQSQYDKLYKNEVKNEWMKEAYSGVYADLQTFNSVTMSGYKMSAKTNPMLTASKDSTVATATANADAASMAHTVTVTQLASNAYMQTWSGQTITRLNTDSPKSIYLKDILYSSSDLTAAQSNYASMSDEQKAANVLSFTISDGADGATGTNTKTISFSYKDLFESNQTLNDLATKIKNSGVNINAQYDATNDSFSLYNKTGGSTNQIHLTVADDSSGTTDDMARSLLNNLKLGVVNTDNTITTLKDLSSSNTGMTASGQSAQATIDGKVYTSNTNKISASNVAYTLTAAGTTTVTVSQDTDTLVGNVKQFVADYNKMIDELNTKYSEPQYSSYGVLTQSQQNSMTADQITKWNEKAKSGLLYHDKNVGDAISSMRQAIYTPVSSVDSNYNTMMSIGVTSATDQGHLKLDEDKLRKALAADPDCVSQLFASSGDVTDSTGKTTTDYNKQGVVNRIYDSVNQNMAKMKDYAGTSTESSDGSTLGNLIRDLKTKMSDFKTQMDAYEDKLYNQYDAMEVAIQKLSSSMNYITGSKS